MSSFAMFLLEGGVDVAVAVDFERVASLQPRWMETAIHPIRQMEPPKPGLNCLRYGGKSLNQSS